MKDSWQNPLFYKVTLMVYFFTVQDSGDIIIDVKIIA